MAPRLPPDLLPDLELARLNALAAIALPERQGLAALGAPMVAPHLLAIAGYIDDSGYRLDLGRAYRDWYDRHPGHPAAESAAWGETRLQRPVTITTADWVESSAADAGPVPAFRSRLGAILAQSCTPQTEAAAPPPAKTLAPAAPCKPAVPDGVSLSSAAGSLACQAEQQRQAGDYAGAAATLERALRVTPREAYLWNRLARVYLEQGSAVQAGELAARSNGCVGIQTAVEQDNWRIIAEAKRRSGDAAGADEAEQRAGGTRSLSSRSPRAPIPSTSAP